VNNPAALIAAGHRQLLGSEIPPAATERLERYLALLGKWNRKINLVARDSIEHWIDFHFCDSMIMAIAARKAEEMADIGSGAGFPSLVVKCLLPDLPLTMIEPRAKRAVFLRQTASHLGLAGVRIEERRAEEVGKKFSIVTSRALAEVKVFLHLAAPLLKGGGQAATLKGNDLDEELALLAADPISENFSPAEITPYTLPVSGRRRNLLIFKKK